MAKVLHAILILIIASGSSLLALGETSTKLHSAVSAGSGSPPSTLTTTANAKADNTLSSQATTHTSVSSPNSTHTSTSSTATTTSLHPTNRSETTTHSNVTGKHTVSVTTSHEGNGSVPEHSTIKTTQVSRNDSTGTTMLKTTNLQSTKHSETTSTTKKMDTTTASASQGNSLTMNPGLVAVLCIFFIVLALVLVVVIAKVITAFRKPKFERLDDLPMGKISEDAPFARYPPK